MATKEARMSATYRAKQAHRAWLTRATRHPRLRIEGYGYFWHDTDTGLLVSLKPNGALWTIEAC